MNLASRLDRLRGPGITRAQTVCTLATDYSNSSRPVPGTSPGSTLMAPLIEALGAELQSAGLLLRCTEHAVPALMEGSRELMRLPEACGLSDPDWVYIDTETTGLSGGAGNLAFMLGAARYYGPGRLEVRQFVLGSFAAEADMLRSVRDWVGPQAVLVSYNGKCFDLPVLENRLRMHGIGGTFGHRAHLDLMYSVRRAFRKHWPDCRLQTAERRLLDLRRRDDLPGAQAPAAWQSWLRHGRTRALTRVLSHNFQDVVSLALLHRRLSAIYAGVAQDRLDHTAIGNAWLKAGRPELARLAWERAGSHLDEEASLQLAGLYRRSGDWCRAVRIWRDLYTRGSTRGALALSKYYEHRMRDFPRAIDFAAGCDSGERELRFRRLQKKLGPNLQLPL